MHPLYFLYAGICPVTIAAAAIFGLRICRKIRDKVDQAIQDEKIRLEIMQTEGDAVEKQTHRFETALKKHSKKREKQTTRTVEKGSKKRAGSI
jgi:hypothetical protein